MVRSNRRWQTTFGQWVRVYTVSRLAHDLNARGAPATPKAIYHWLAGRCMPHPTRAAAMVQLGGGKLSLNDVFAHHAQVRTAGHASTPRAPG